MNKKMTAFGALMIGHWLEHGFQAYQVYYQHMPRACALGMLGMKYPWLVKTESLHFSFALLTTGGLILLRDYCKNCKAKKFWKVATYISYWHLFEHSLLFAQACLHHNLFHSKVPVSILQLLIPRIELHLFYNTLITIPILIALGIEFGKKYSKLESWTVSRVGF